MPRGVPNALRCPECQAAGPDKLGTAKRRPGFRTAVAWAVACRNPLCRHVWYSTHPRAKPPADADRVAPPID